MDDRNPIVLIVEDEWLVRCCVAEALTEAGFEVIEAEHGESAMIVLKQHAPDIDVLFTDIRMPGAINGLELAKLGRDLIPRLAVLIASGNYHPDFSIMPEGSRFLSKPYGFRDVALQVRALIHDRPTAAP